MSDGKQNYERIRARKEVEAEWGHAAAISRNREDLATQLFIASVFLRAFKVEDPTNEAVALLAAADTAATAAIGPK